jgi:hypothetical protein
MKSTAMPKLSAIVSAWITPSPMADKDGVRKLARQSSPITRHAINIVGTYLVEDMLKKVELDDDDDGVKGIAFALTNGYTLLIPQSSFL